MKTRNYYVVKSNSVLGTIRLRGNQVKQYSISMGVILFRHLPAALRA